MEVMFSPRVFVSRLSDGENITSIKGFVNKSSIDSMKLMNNALAESGFSKSDILEIIRILIVYILVDKWLSVKKKPLFILVVFGVVIMCFRIYLDILEIRSRSPPRPILFLLIQYSLASQILPLAIFFSYSRWILPLFQGKTAEEFAGFF